MDDDIGTTNPLPDHSWIHKLGMFYFFTLLDIPRQYHRPSNIYLLAVVNTVIKKLMDQMSPMGRYCLPSVAGVRGDVRGQPGVTNSEVIPLLYLPIQFTFVASINAEVRRRST